MQRKKCAQTRSVARWWMGRIHRLTVLIDRKARPTRVKALNQSMSGPLYLDQIALAGGVRANWLEPKMGDPQIVSWDATRGVENLTFENPGRQPPAAGFALGRFMDGIAFFRLTPCPDQIRQLNSELSACLRATDACRRVPAF